MIDRTRVLSACFVILLLAGVLSATPIEDALDLIDARRLDEARELLTATVESADESKLRSDALELLGDVEVWEEDFEGAREIWSRVLEEFPDSVAASYARTKLRLLDEILGPVATPMEGEGVVASRSSTPTEPMTEPMTGPSEPVAASAPEPAAMTAPEAAMEGEGEVEAGAGPTPEPATPAPAPKPTPADAPSGAVEVRPAGVVLLAGDGQPSEAIEPVLDRLVEYLREAGVEVEIPDQAIWWRRELSMVERSLAEEAAGSGFLWVDFRFGHRERVRLRCVEGRGGEAWAEQVKGGMGFADHRPHDTYNHELVERLLSKVDRRLGEACLSQSR